MVRCGSGRMRAARGPGSPSQPRPAASVAGRAIGAGQLIAGITSRVAHAAVSLLPARAPRSRKRTQTVKHTAPADVRPIRDEIERRVLSFSTRELDVPAAAVR